MRARRNPREGSIYQRNSDGRWVAEVERSRGPNGERRRLKYTVPAILNGREVQDPYSKARTALVDLKAEAARLEAEEKAAAEKAAGLVGDERTVEAFLEDWVQNELPNRKRRGKPNSIATRENYATMVYAHLIPTIGHIELRQLKPKDVDRMMRKMEKAGYALATIRLARTVLGQALKHAERDELVAKNVVEPTDVPGDVEDALEVRAFDDEEEQKRRRSRPTKDNPYPQASAFLAACENDPMGPLFATMLRTGIRPGEAMGLRRGDVDLVDGTLRVEQAVKRNGRGKLTLGPPKTERSRRTLALPTSAVDALARQLDDQDRQREEAGHLWRETGLLFTNSYGKMLDPSNVRKRFGVVVKAAGIRGDWWHPHSLRHTWISHQVDAGEPLSDIAHAAGHSSTAMIERVYGHRMRATQGTQAAVVTEARLGKPAGRR